MAVNVLGTWHVLLAAEEAGVSQVICFSSAHGAYVDVRDVAAAVRQALTVPCRSPTLAAIREIPGPPSSTAQPPRPRSAGVPPAGGPDVPDRQPRSGRLPPGQATGPKRRAPSDGKVRDGT
jgi:hypothetical protein